MVDGRYGYYECGTCGHQSQVLTEVERQNPYTGEMEMQTDVDGEASYLLACEHDKEHESK